MGDIVKLYPKDNESENTQDQEAPGLLKRAQLRLTLLRCKLALRRKPLSEKIRLKIIDCLTQLNRWEEAEKVAIELKYIDQLKDRHRKEMDKYNRE